MATLADAELAANQVWDETQQQLAAARDLDAKFSNAETANNKLMELNSKGEEMAALEKRVAKAAEGPIIEGCGGCCNSGGAGLGRSTQENGCGAQ